MHACHGGICPFARLSEADELQHPQCQGYGQCAQCTAHCQCDQQRSSGCGGCAGIGQYDHPQ